jgi:hypothetical protein
MKKLKLKSIGAVVAGFICVALLSILTDSIFEKMGIFPGTSQPQLYTAWMLWISLAYRSVFTIVGGYVTARLAPQKPMSHVYALMVLGFIGGVAGVVGGWDLGNHWYPILLAITGPVFVYWGGKLTGCKQ